MGVVTNLFVPVAGTWGYVDGDYIITDLRGFAYSADGDPIMYLLPDGSTWKHVRLSSRR